MQRWRDKGSKSLSGTQKVEAKKQRKLRQMISSTWLPTESPAAIIKKHKENENQSYQETNPDIK